MRKKWMINSIGFEEINKSTLYPCLCQYDTVTVIKIDDEYEEREYRKGTYTWREIYKIDRNVQ